MPDAWPIAAGGTEVITALIVTGIATDAPQPASSRGATIWEYGRLAPASRASSAIQVSAPATTVRPPAISGRSPRRLMSAPVKGAITVSVAHPGSSRSPAPSGP